MFSKFHGKPSNFLLIFGTLMLPATGILELCCFIAFSKMEKYIVLAKNGALFQENSEENTGLSQKRYSYL